MDVTTVGSNIIAVTPTGRVLSVLLAALGMMMFPIFTVYVTSLVERRKQGKRRVLTKSCTEACAPNRGFLNRLKPELSLIRWEQLPPSVVIDADYEYIFHLKP